jgi:hypothetical protein
MKAQEYLRLIDNCTTSDLIDKYGVYDNHITLLQSPLVGIARDMITQGYCFIPRTEHLSSGILLEKNGVVNLNFNKSKSISRDMSTDRGYRPEKNLILHSEIQLERYDRTAVMLLAGNEIYKTGEDMAEKIAPYILNFTSYLVNRGVAFCLPFALPEPVYFPDKFEDIVANFLEKTK